MANKRKAHTPEFKPAAVKVVAEQKPSAAEVARRPGATENRLRDWKEAPAAKIEAFCDRIRRHSSRGYVAPDEYERAHDQTHR